jgi:hypothetical protein
MLLGQQANLFRKLIFEIISSKPHIDTKTWVQKTAYDTPIFKDVSCLPSQREVDIDECQPMREEKTVERVSVNICGIRK